MAAGRVRQGGDAPPGLRWNAIQQALLSSEHLFLPLRDSSIQPPQCFFSSGAITTPRERRAYDIMAALVSADVLAQARSSATSVESRTSGEPKRRRRKSTRRR